MRASARSISLAPCSCHLSSSSPPTAAGAKTDPKLEQAAGQGRGRHSVRLSGQDLCQKRDRGYIAPARRRNQFKRPATSAGVKASRSKSAKAAPATHRREGEHDLGERRRRPRLGRPGFRAPSCWRGRRGRRQGECRRAPEESFNLLAWQTPIWKNQGSRGTCYAFAFTAGLEAGLHRQQIRQDRRRRVSGPAMDPVRGIAHPRDQIDAAQSTADLSVRGTRAPIGTGVLGVVGDPLMTSVLSEQLMSYRIPEAKYSPYLALSNLGSRRARRPD